jgi:hypothetical protein
LDLFFLGKELKSSIFISSSKPLKSVHLTENP